MPGSDKSQDEQEKPVGLHSCGWPEDSFACKIRHLQINTGDAKAAAPDRWRRANDLHNDKFNS